MSNKKLEKKQILNQCIENIEQLGADARYWNDYDNYKKLKIQLESIDWWVKKAQQLVEKIDKESE